MKIKTIKSFILIVALTATIKTNAQISLPKIIGNEMILQRNQPAPIWGFASAGEKITVNFNGQKKQTTADEKGNWKIMLDAMQANATPQKMIIEGKNTIELNDILIGEIWLCSGQSNMEYSMRKNSKVTVPPGKNWPEVNELDNAHEKNIRIFLVDRKKMNPDPKHLGWAVAEDSALRSFSAAGYFFAKKLFAELHVPIGVIEAAIPGSRIEPWMPREAMTALPFFQNQTDLTHKIEGDPGKFYSTMIEPLAPFALKGFLWYQGETNCFLKETIQYTYKMNALINQWRKIWNSNSLPFYYVGIAPFKYSISNDTSTRKDIPLNENSLPEFWEAQSTALKIPNTGMVITTDLNDKPGELHPHFKWEIGRRLALLALNKTYNQKQIVPSGPIYQSNKIIGNKIIIDFSDVDGGLQSNDGKPLSLFEIAGKDGKFVPAKAEINNNQVIVSADEIKNPTAVRFGWRETECSNYYNKAGLPAMPFRTDNPLIKAFKVQ